MNDATDSGGMDVLAELGLLPGADDGGGGGGDGVELVGAERRSSPRVPAELGVSVVMLAGGKPVSEAFTVRMRDVSRDGVRVTGCAPLLRNAKAAVELKKSDGSVHVLGASVMHSTFGDPFASADTTVCTAGLRFEAIPEEVKRRAFGGVR